MLGKKIDKSFGENVCSDLVLQQFCGDRIRNCKYWLDCIAPWRELFAGIGNWL